MRILAWNVGHQTRPKAIPTSAADAIESLEIDVLVLTEFVRDSINDSFVARLQSRFGPALVSGRVPGQNQLLIAGRCPIKAGSIEMSDELSPAPRPNWLHVQAGSFDIVGLRRAMFKAVANGQTRYWQEASRRLAPLLSQPTVVIGDFNCAATSSCLAPLRAEGWTVICPQGWSFMGKTGKTSTIDLALTTPSVSVADATYVSSANTFAFAGEANAYSDHAAFIVEVAT